MRERKFRAYHDRWEWAKPTDITIYGNGQFDVDYRGDNGDIIETYCQNDKELHLVEFTGLHDKHGKEIFEGDILATSCEGDQYTDAWTKKEYGYTVVEEFDPLDGYEFSEWSPADDGESVYDLEHIEIIGNIYENPALLTEPNQKG